MNRLNKWLLGLLVVQIAALIVIRLAPAGAPVEKRQKLFEGKLDQNAVTRIRVTGNDGKKVELVKQGGGWVLASGGDFPVLAGKVSDLLGKLPTLAAGSPVTSKPAHHRALEVAGDGFQRELVIEQAGKPALHFFLGTSAGLKDVHLRMNGQDAVYLVKDLSAWDAGTTAADWVSTEYLKVARDAIVGVDLQNAEGAIELRKGEDGKWTLTDLAEGTKLKDSEVESLLGSLSSVALQEPVGQKVEASHGLDKPAATITVLVKEKKDEPKALKLLVGVKAGDAYFAKSDTSPFVVKLSSWSAETFTKKKKSDFEEKPKDESKDRKDEHEGHDHGGEPPMPMPGGEGEP